MNSKMLRQYLLEQKTTLGIVFIFVVLAAMLSATSLSILTTAFGAMNRLMQQAQTPHLLQMHRGRLDLEKLQRFAAADSRIAGFQVSEFLNIPGHDILVAGRPLKDQSQDNGLSIQNEHFDFLLDFGGKVIRPRPGEIYLPISYRDEATVGSKMSVAGRPLTVAGVLRDSQMNTKLSSSKRFLVHPQDLAALRQRGTTEYLIEFRVRDLADLSAVEQAYQREGLPANGPTVTYPLFRMLNAFSEGMQFAILLLASLLMTLISLICIGFILRTKLEEDVREIGIMKALGLPHGFIRGLYLRQYALIAAVGGVAGWLLSLLLRQPLLDNVRLYFGHYPAAWPAYLVEAAGLLLLWVTILLFVTRLLGRLRQVSAVAALRAGQAPPLSARPVPALPGKGSWPLEVSLGVQALRLMPGRYLTYAAIIILALLMLLLPQNVLGTLSSPNFATHMGIGKSDIRIDLQQRSDIEQQGQALAAAVAADPRIRRQTLLVTKRFEVMRPDRTPYQLNIELGDHSVFPVSYVSGQLPRQPDEVALSVLSADDLGLKVGDALPVRFGKDWRTLRVSGTYSDVTNGGKTAKAPHIDSAEPTMWAILYGQLRDKDAGAALMNDYRAKFPAAKITDIGRYMQQIYGPTLQAIARATLISLLVASGMMALISVLFTWMLIAQERQPIAVQRALGFGSASLRRQYLIQFASVFVVASLLGVGLLYTAGQVAVGLLLSSLGIASFRFEASTAQTLLLSLLWLGGVALATTWFASRRVRSVALVEGLKE